MLDIFSSCAIVTLSSRGAVFPIFDFQKCRDLEIRVRGNSRSLKVVPFCRLGVVSLKPGLGSLKVIENDTIQSGTYDFLLTFHSNHRPISHHFRDKWRFPSKIANFSHPRVLNTPAEGVPLEIGYRRRGQKKLE